MGNVDLARTHCTGQGENAYNVTWEYRDADMDNASKALSLGSIYCHSDERAWRDRDKVLVLVLEKSFQNMYWKTLSLNRELSTFHQTRHQHSG